MKIRFAAGVFTVLTVLCAGFAPGWVLQSVVQVPYIYGKEISHQETLLCTGQVQAQRMQEVVIPSNVVMDEVLVSVGDQVQQGQVLARVNQESTQLVWKGMEQQTAGETEDGESSDQSELSQEIFAWAQQYGLSAEEVAAYLQQQGEGTMSSSSVDLSQNLPQEYTAPISGTVLEVPVASAQVTKQTGIIQIADLSQLTVTAQVPENQIQQVQVGDSATVWLSDGGETQAMVQKIHPSTEQTWNGEQMENVVLVELSLDSPDASLRVGSTVQISIAVSQEETYFSIPYEAIRQDESGQEYLYLLEGCHPIRYPITTGNEMENCVQVMGDIPKDQAILYDPDLIEGEKTMVRPGQEVKWDG